LPDILSAFGEMEALARLSENVRLDETPRGCDEDPLPVIPLFADTVLSPTAEPSIEVIVVPE